MCGGVCSTQGCRNVCQPKNGQPVRIQRRLDDGPISGQEISDKMAAICGCNGKVDCDCVSVEKLARVALWTEHNQVVQR